MKIHAKIAPLKNTIINTRRDFHKHPELSFKEFRTSKIVAEKLKNFGIETKKNIGKTGVVGILKVKKWSYYRSKSRYGRTPNSRNK